VAEGARRLTSCSERSLHHQCEAVCSAFSGRSGQHMLFSTHLSGAKGPIIRDGAVLYNGPRGHRRTSSSPPLPTGLCWLIFGPQESRQRHFDLGRKRPPWWLGMAHDTFLSQVPHMSFIVGHVREGTARNISLRHFFEMLTNKI
jgi:hypothetical protein